ncbi:MAG: SGNH/GDSL hydrolase family protein [Galactobacter sp.]
MSRAAETRPSRRAFLTGAGAALTGIALAGCAQNMVRPGQDFPAPASETAEPGETPEPTTFVVYGDSLTAGRRKRLTFGLPPVDTWLGHLGPGLLWSGGAAVSGATAQALPAMLTTAPRADYGIYFFGTNDRRHGRSVEEMVADIAEAHASILPARRPETPCLVAVGPQGSAALSSAVDTWNIEVRLSAEELGWGYLDPWGQLRASASAGGPGQWASAGIHRDQLHPTEGGAKLLAAGMEAALGGLVQKS